jgi:hypothetical protein
VLLNAKIGTAPQRAFNCKKATKEYWHKQASSQLQESTQELLPTVGVLKICKKNSTQG